MTFPTHFKVGGTITKGLRQQIYSSGNALQFSFYLYKKEGNYCSDHSRSLMHVPFVSNWTHYPHIKSQYQPNKIHKNKFRHTIWQLYLKIQIKLSRLFQLFHFITFLALHPQNMKHTKMGGCCNFMFLNLAIKCDYKTHRMRGSKVHILFPSESV